MNTLQVLAYNEIFEVAYFSSLLSNVTKGVDGYTDLPMDKDYIISILTAVVAVSFTIFHSVETDAFNSKKSYTQPVSTLF